MFQGAINKYGKAEIFIFEVLIWLDFGVSFILFRWIPGLSRFLVLSLVLYINFLFFYS